MESKQPKDEDKLVNIQELQKEIIEMRQQLPEAYKEYLEKDFKQFKNRLSNIVAERKLISDSLIDVDSDDSTLEPTNKLRNYDGDDLNRYINNALMFVNNLKKNNENRK